MTKEKSNDFLPYKVEPSWQSLETGVQICNAVCSLPDVLEMANPLEIYETLLKSILSNERLHPVYMKDFMGPIPAGKTLISLRHDVDQDIVAALQMSRLAARLGVPSTYYLKHTSMFYGQFSKGIFYRHNCFAPVYREIQLNGAEVGLHTDALSVYLFHGMDGTESIVRELEWLRSLGLNITGTSAHGSAGYYGAENFEVFKGRAIWNKQEVVRKGVRFYYYDPLTTTYIQEAEVVAREVRIPLQTLDESELGLEYEGTFARPVASEPTPAAQDYLSRQMDIRDEETFRDYIFDNPYFRFDYDFNIWLLAKDSWCISGHKERDTLFRFDVHLADVLGFLEDLPTGKRVVLCLHPLYLGLRQSEPEPEHSFQSVISLLFRVLFPKRR